MDASNSAPRIRHEKTPPHPPSKIMELLELLILRSCELNIVSPSGRKNYASISIAFFVLFHSTSRP